mgnify:CR=1 FL=1
MNKKIMLLFSILLCITIGRSGYPDKNFSMRLKRYRSMLATSIRTMQAIEHELQLVINRVQVVLPKKNDEKKNRKKHRRQAVPGGRYRNEKDW